MYLRQPVLGRTVAFGDIYNIEEAKFLSTSDRLEFPAQAFSFINHSSITFQYVFTDTIHEKFNLFEVPPELQLHFLGHVLEVKGSGRFLCAEKSSAKTVQVSLLYRVITKTAVLNIAHPDCWKSCNLEELAKCALPNRCLVTEITFGGMVVVSAQDRNEDDRDTATVVEELFHVLGRLSKVLWPETPLTERDFANTEHLSWTVYSDFVENSISCPTFHEVVEQVENAIATSKYSNEGFGIPIFYTFCSLQHCLNVASPFCSPGYLGFPGFPRIDTDVILFFVNVFDDISMKKQQVNDLHDAMQKYELCVAREHFELCNNLLKQCQQTCVEMREELANALWLANCGGNLIDTITEFKREFEVKQHRLANIDFDISYMHHVHERINRLDVLIKKGVIYCTSNCSNVSKIRSHPSDVYILRYIPNVRIMQNNWLEICDTFFRMLNDPSISSKGALFVFADNGFAESCGTDIKARICHVNDGNAISAEMLGDCMTNDEIVCLNADHCTSFCREMKSSNGPPDTGRSMNLTQKSADHITVIKTNEGLPNSSPLKQNTDFRTHLADRSGVSGNSAQEAVGQVSKAVNQSEGTSEDSSASAAGNPSASGNSQIASMQERVHVDEQERHQGRDCRRMDAKHNGMQKPALQHHKTDLNLCDVKQAHISRPQQNRTEEQTMDARPKDKPRKPNEQSSKSRGDSTGFEHQFLGKLPSSSESLPEKTNSAYSRNQTVIPRKSRKNIDQLSGSFCKTGYDGSAREEFQGKIDKAVKGLTNKLASSISTSRKPVMEKVDPSNRAPANQPESCIKPTEQVHSKEQKPQGCSNWTLVKGRQWVNVGRGRSQKSAMQQTSADMPLRVDKLIDGSGLQSKAKGQSAHLAGDTAQFKQSRLGKTSSEGSPKSKNKTFSKFLNGDISEGPLTTLPNSSPLKQNTDFRTPSADHCPEMIEVYGTGVSDNCAQEARGQVLKTVNQPIEASEDSSSNAAGKQPASRNIQISIKQEGVYNDVQERHEAIDQRRMDAQQNRAEGQSMDALPKNIPRKPNEQSSSNSHADSTSYEHHCLGKSPLEGLPDKTNSAYSRNQTVSPSKSCKNVDQLSETFCKTGHNVSASEEVRGKTDKAAKRLTKKPATTVSTSRKPLMENGDQPESCIRPTEQEPKGCSNWTLVQGRRLVNVGRGRSQKSARLQTSADMPFRIDKLVDGSGLQSKAEGQAAQLLERDTAHVKQSRQGKKMSSESSPKSRNGTFSKFSNKAILEGRLTADPISGSCPSDGQFEDYEEKVGENSGKSVNILLLGESGVGKSTWINGVANYLAYSTVQEAARSKPVHVIHSSFLLTDDDFNEVLVTMGPGGDGKMKLGDSATQTTKFYPLPAGDGTIRLIDTPGIGDTRGMDKDQENFQSIFSHLSQLPQLHGICILLKPNSARMTASFQFCIRELLLHLHRDACKNVVFVFTSSRGTFYRPGDTFPTLSSLLRENKEANIPLDSEHVYCMDNEPVRFLAATKQGVKFTDSDKDNYSKSWEVSKAETERLIAHVSGLEPHAVEKTLRLNDVMNARIAVARPLVAFAKDLQVEILRAETHVREPQNTPTIPNVHHGDPEGRVAKMIVCCRPFCERARRSSSHSRTYSNICHRPCKHNIRVSDGFRNEDVKECEVMGSKSGICSSCGCDWWWHQCVRCELGVEHSKDSGYKNDNSANAGDKVSLEAEKSIAQMKLEQRSILQAGAKAGIFLKQNTLGACSDVVAEQLKRDIEKEREQVALYGSRQALDALTEVLATYKKEAGRHEEDLKQKQAEIQFCEVQQSFDELRSLPIKGNVLRSRVVDVWNASCKTDDHHRNRTSFAVQRVQEKVIKRLESS